MTKKQFNAFKRLQRIGDENSKASLKLKEACAEVGKYLKSLVPNNITDSPYISMYDVRGLYVCFGNLEYDISMFDAHDICDQERLTIEVCYKFAQHIANGLIDDFESWAGRREIKKEGE